ncbi:NfeD family protein [Plectonema cf. radiosum LEGE 06105]|uniref:NfeD family protein n=1 Tax=Plectonema cf. radiosum LEGE 06105 TaxID=945769 RepID=A0A8J7F2K7_9CYAN|nr:NfeD family protein [Plectonema radiosum]MBE9214978.1 NfeD family protein [Plectonema cf. radiosum LEGE 06105]
MIDRLDNNRVTSKKRYNMSDLIQKMKKVNSAIAIALFALVFTGCDANDQIGTVESTEQTPGAAITGDTTIQTPIPTTDANIPQTTGAASPDATDNIPASAALPAAELIGETVTVSTKVTEIVGPKAFVAYDKESLRGQPILVVSDQDAPAVGTNIEVTGVVGSFDAAVIKRDYDLDFNPDIVKVYENQPYLAAKAIEKVD